VRTDPYRRVDEQATWRTCSKCSALVFSRLLWDGTAEKPCGAGGLHTLQPAEYFLTWAQRDSGSLFWRWCSKCQLIAWNGHEAPGPCPAGGIHDHSGSPFYTAPHFLGEVNEVAFPAGAAGFSPGQSYVNSNGTVKFEVLSFNGVSASVRVTSS
jgi:hypothetical protein